MSNKSEKADYLQRHLRYELLMMRHALASCRRPRDQLDWNAFYESFAVHARNLYAFLCNDGTGNNVKMRDFVRGFMVQKTDRTIATFQKLHPQVLHVGKARPADAPGKATLAEVEEVAAWIEESFARFIDELPEPERSAWDWDTVEPSRYYGRTIDTQPTTSSAPTQSSAPIEITGLWPKREK